ncbi:MAG: phosphopyruvate hydratase, partial [Nitrososphaerales archaeon]
MPRDSIVKKLFAREILDSRGNPTIEVEAHVGAVNAVASVPSGASKGLHESVELRDGDKRRYLGLGVTKAVREIRKTIAPSIQGMDALNQSAIDSALKDLDGTASKSRLGANTILGVSIAVCKAAAKSLELPVFQYLSQGNVKPKSLPTPLLNVINGGKHAGNELTLQEFMIIPTGAVKFNHALWIGTEIYHNLRIHLRKLYGNAATNVGDEGGYAPPLSHTKEALECLVKAVEMSGYVLGKEVR